MTLCGWYARQTISLFWRETKQRPELEISDEIGSRGGKGIGKGTQRGSVGEGRRREAVDNGQQKRPVGMRQSPGDGRPADGGSEEDGQR